MGNFSRLIYSARKRLNIRQADVAQQLGVSQATIAAWETERQYPPESRLAKICNVLNIEAGMITSAFQSDQAKRQANRQATRNEQDLAKIIEVMRVGDVAHTWHIGPNTQMLLGDVSIRQYLADSLNTGADYSVVFDTNRASWKDIAPTFRDLSCFSQQIRVPSTIDDQVTSGQINIFIVSDGASNQREDVYHAFEELRKDGQLRNCRVLTAPIEYYPGLRKLAIPSYQQLVVHVSTDTRQKPRSWLLMPNITSSTDGSCGPVSVELDEQVTCEIEGNLYKFGRSFGLNYRIVPSEHDEQPL